MEEKTRKAIKYGLIVSCAFAWFAITSQMVARVLALPLHRIQILDRTPSTRSVASSQFLSRSTRLNGSTQRRHGQILLGAVIV